MSSPFSSLALNMHLIRFNTKAHFCLASLKKANRLISGITPNDGRKQIE
jgi:hypothetical protein